MPKKLLCVCAGLLITLGVVAGDAQLADNHPDTYTVKSGDTLWSIAAHFLKRPWEWPQIWQSNPQVRNPHLIYPGDVLSLSYIDGRNSLGLDGPQVRASGKQEAIKPIPLAAVKPFLKHARILNEDEFKHLPHVVAIEENRLLGASGQLVYVRGLSAQPGQQYALARPTNRYHEITPTEDRVDEHRETLRQPIDSRDGQENMLWHHAPYEISWHSRVEFLGYEVMDFGTVQVTRAGEPSSALVLDSDFEVHAGDLIVPIDTHTYDAEFAPHAPTQVPDNMRVLSFTDAIDVVGPMQVVALSRGAHDGIENGQVFAIYHPGEVINDNSGYPESSMKAFLHPKDKQVQLPEEYIGHVMIFRTFDRISYGLVMDGIRPVHLLDRLHGPDLP